MARPPGRRNPLDSLLAVAVLLLIIWLAWHFSHSPARRKKIARHVAAEPSSSVITKEETKKIIVPAKPIPPQPADAAPPTATPGDSPRHPHGTLEGQIALSRAGISCGSLDGALGSQTRAAIRTFQRNAHLPETGALDSATRAALTLATPPLTSYTTTTNDLAHLQPVSKTWLGKSQQNALDYETILELIAEKSHAHPKLIKLLNPGVDWPNVAAGTTLTVPDANYPAPQTKAAFVVISLSEKTLEAFDEQTNLLAHFPCSIARRVEKRPVGELHIAAIAPNPNYTFDPAIFPEEPEAQQIHNKLIIPPGPNNPVGTVWISLDLTGYGIHGTPHPEDVGRTESHGCFRLANWNAEFFLKLAWVGLPVRVEP